MVGKTEEIWCEVTDDLFKLVRGWNIDIRLAVMRELQDHLPVISHCALNC